jgi:hypothetical protein
VAKYKATVTMTAECEFYFSDDDILSAYTLEAAALELVHEDFAGTDPFRDEEYKVKIEVLDED